MRLAFETPAVELVKQLSPRELTSLLVAAQAQYDTLKRFVNVNPPLPQENALAYIRRMRAAYPEERLLFFKHAFEVI